MKSQNAKHTNENTKRRIIKFDIKNETNCDHFMIEYGLHINPLFFSRSVCDSLQD